MGRPPKPEKSRKDELIRIRVTADQKDAFEQVAETAGLDVSAWLRALGVKEVQRARKEVGATGALSPTAEAPATRDPERGP